MTASPPSVRRLHAVPRETLTDVLAEAVLAALLGAFGPLRRLDRWQARLSWRGKLVCTAALVCAGTAVSVLAQRHGTDDHA